MSPLDTSNSINYFEQDYAQLVSYLENTDSSLKKLLKIPSKRLVKFSDEVKVYSRGAEFTNQDRESVWYSSEEYASIKVTVKDSLKRMKKFEKEDDSIFCYRGLEGRTKVGSRTRQRNREGVIYAVLMEQHLQEEDAKLHYDSDTSRNVDCIALASIQASLPARAAARVCAENDEKCAIALYTDWVRVELSTR